MPLPSPGINPVQGFPRKVETHEAWVCDIGSWSRSPPKRYIFLKNGSYQYKREIYQALFLARICCPDEYKSMSSRIGLKYLKKRGWQTEEELHDG
ncbi:MAG: hypothetical protein ACRC6N_06950 [Plesiomonas sp.]|uniref:hypothetical protein n=1 Tax=Plesiomonas sp. TaxID=2486279 RepID=UPI003F3898D3